MSWNNIIPAWLLADICPKCGHKVLTRDKYPGIECKECGGECIRELQNDHS